MDSIEEFNLKFNMSEGEPLESHNVLIFLRSLGEYLINFDAKLDKPSSIGYFSSALIREFDLLSTSKAKRRLNIFSLKKNKKSILLSKDISVEKPRVIGSLNEAGEYLIEISKGEIDELFCYIDFDTERLFPSSDGWVTDSCAENPSLVDHFLEAKESIPRLFSLLKSMGTPDYIKRDKFYQVISILMTFSVIISLVAVAAVPNSYAQLFLSASLSSAAFLYTLDIINKARIGFSSDDLDRYTWFSKASSLFLIVLSAAYSVRVSCDGQGQEIIYISGLGLSISILLIGLFEYYLLVVKRATHQ